jgi:hydrogenase/urease accessory protein HupE
VVKTYFFQGVKHILNGFDHLLFLCALVLGVASLWDLVKIVTAFTIAHSLTLTLATFGLVHLPSWIVEPLIAGSIVFVAVQNIIRPQDAGSKGRLAIAFFFGLFHGLGFAGGLLEVMHAMPVHTVVFALLGFSIGVEAGNQLVLLPLYGMLRGLKKIKTRQVSSGYPLLIRTASALVAIAGIYYLVIAVNEVL